MKRKRLRNGYIEPVSLEEKYRMALDFNDRHPKPDGERWDPEEMHLYVSTLGSTKAGRLHTNGNSNWYSNPFKTFNSDYDDYPLFMDWLDKRFTQTCVRRQLFEERPKDGSIPHYVVQKGMPRAFTYAVGLGNGIKVGKSGTGDGDLLQQVNGRLGGYKTTHDIEVIGICDHYLRDIDKEETELLKRLSAYKLNFGDEMFKDCTEVRDIVWDWFGAAWHQDRPISSDAVDSYEDNYEGAWGFHSLKGNIHHFAFDWRDYIRLVEEIELLNFVGSNSEHLQDERLERGDLYIPLDKETAIYYEQRKKDDKDYDPEEEDEDFYFKDYLNYYLPESESLYPSARKRLKAFLGWEGS